MKWLDFGGNIVAMLDEIMAQPRRSPVHIALRLGADPGGLSGWFVVVTWYDGATVWVAYEAVLPDLDSQVTARQHWSGQAGMLRRLPLGDALAHSGAWPVDAAAPGYAKAPQYFPPAAPAAPPQPAAAAP